MGRVIVASEDMPVAEVLAAELAGEGHEVEVVHTGIDALDAAVGADLVFLDADLPVLDGFEVCSRLRGDPDIPGELPVILLANRDLEPHAVARAGATAVFPKTHAAYELRELATRHLHA